jgi:hypothetical protein
MVGMSAPEHGLDGDWRVFVSQLRKNVKSLTIDWMWTTRSKVSVQSLLEFFLGWSANGVLW